MSSQKKKLWLIILLIISIGYLLLYCHPLVISSDETYTLSLVHHSFPRVIYLDSLDVHPPLYYILLKIFINRLTFWTNNVAIKVITARLFSILATLITFIYLIKYVRQLGIRIHKIILWCLFLALPNVLGIRFLFQQMTNVRMYALAAMFVTITVYYSFQFHNQDDSVMNWTLMTFFAVASTYTHYYAAMFVGLLILINLIISIKHSASKRIIKGFGGTLLVLILAYLPWIKIFYHQIIRSDIYWMTNGIMIRDLVIYLILFGIFVYPLFKYCQRPKHRLFKQQIIKIIISLTIVFFLTLGFSLIRHPIFLSRYFYPLLIIYEFLGLCATWDTIRKPSGLKCNKAVIAVILLINVAGSAAYQIHNINPQTVKTYQAETRVNQQTAPVQLKSDDNLSLLQNYAYILYQGNHRSFNLKSANVQNPILDVHQQTYSDITKYIQK